MPAIGGGSAALPELGVVENAEEIEVIPSARSSQITARASRNFRPSTPSKSWTSLRVTQSRISLEEDWRDVSLGQLQRLTSRDSLPYLVGWGGPDA